MTTNLKSDRINSIDALRGFALAGVALVHMVEQYIAGIPPEGFMAGINSLPDQIVQGFIQFFFSGKFFALFSILFGLSFSIQMDSANSKGVKFEGRFFWRAVLLFIIGYAHQLFYRGDILTIYAVLAPFLIPFYRISSKWILILAGLIFLSIPRLITFLVFPTDGITGIHAMNDGNHELVKQYFETIQHGTLLEVFSANAVYGMLTKIDFQISVFGRFFFTFGYFLIGLWLGRIGLFRSLSSHAKSLKTVLLWSIVAFMISMVIMIIPFAMAPQPIDNGSWYFFLGINFFDWTNIAMSSIILCSFLILYLKPAWEKRLSFFAPYGRMALSNYFLQSVIGTFILFGWGLGYIGQIRSLYLFLMALILIFLQTLISKYWLKKFKYGPLEWLWRSGTYLKWQPLTIKPSKLE